MIRQYTYLFLLIFSFSIGRVLTAYSQTIGDQVNNDSLDTLMVEKGQSFDRIDSIFHEILKEDSLFQFLVKEDLLPHLTMDQMDILSPLKAVYTQYENQQAWLSLSKDQIKTKGKTLLKTPIQLFSQHYFIAGDTSFNQLSTNQNTSEVTDKNWYSSIGLQSSLTNNSIPLTLEGDAIFVQGQFQADLSTISLSFDDEAFLERMRNTYEPSFASLQQLFDRQDNPLNLSAEVWEYVQSTLKYTCYERIINYPKFRAYQTQLSHQLDSLVQHKVQELSLDSLAEFNEHLQQKANIIEQQLDTVQLIIQRYRSSWEEKKQLPYKIRQEVEEKVAVYQAKLEEALDPTKVKQRLMKNDQLKKGERFLLATRAIDLGLFELDDIDLTARYLTLNGIHYEFELDRTYGEVAWGNQSLTTSFIPSLNALWLNRYFGKRFTFAKVGVNGSDDSVYTQFSLLHAKEVGTPQDSIFIVPRKNTVLAWSGQVKLREQTYLKTAFGLSDQAIILATGIDDEDQSRPEKVALALDAILELDQWNARIEAGYFYNGPQYYSLGNPFLLNNRQGVHINANISSFKNRLLWRTDFRYGRAIDKSSIGFQDIQLLGEVRYLFKNQNSMSAQIMPNVYQQSGQLNNIGASNWIYSVQGNFINQLKKAQLISAFTITNLQSNFIVEGTAVASSERLNNYTYAYLQESLLWAENRQINLSAMFGFDQALMTETILSEALLDLDYTHRFADFNLSLGGQLLKRQIYEGQWQYGLKTNLSYQFWSRANLQFNVVYRNQLSPKSTSNLEQYFGDIRIQFSL